MNYLRKFSYTSLHIRENRIKKIRSSYSGYSYGTIPVTFSVSVSGSKGSVSLGGHAGTGGAGD